MNSRAEAFQFHVILFLENNYGPPEGWEVLNKYFMNESIKTKVSDKFRAKLRREERVNWGNLELTN